MPIEACDSFSVTSSVSCNYFQLPDRIWRRSRIAQVIFVVSALRFGKPRFANCLQMPWRGRNLWGVETSPLRPVNTGPVTGGFEAGWNFIWGDFAAAICHEPNQPASAFRIAAFVSGVGNGKLLPFPLPHSHPPPVRPHTNEKTGRVTRLSCCGDPRSHRFRANLNFMHGPVGQETDGKEAGRGHVKGRETIITRETYESSSRYRFLAKSWPHTGRSDCSDPDVPQDCKKD